jgi:hypothetical protein
MPGWQGVARAVSSGVCPGLVVEVGATVGVRRGVYMVSEGLFLCGLA